MGMRATRLQQIVMPLQDLPECDIDHIREEHREEVCLRLSSSGNRPTEE